MQSILTEGVALGLAAGVAVRCGVGVLTGVAFGAADIVASLSARWRESGSGIGPIARAITGNTARDDEQRQHDTRES